MLDFVVSCVYSLYSHGKDQDGLRRPRSEVGVRSVAAGVVAARVFMLAATCQKLIILNKQPIMSIIIYHK